VLEYMAYARLGNHSSHLGNFVEVIEYHTQYLAFATKVRDTKEGGIAYSKLGLAYLKQGDYLKAIECHTQELAIAKELCDRAEEGIACRNLGRAYLSLGDFRKEPGRDWCDGCGQMPAEDSTMLKCSSCRGAPAQYHPYKPEPTHPHQCQERPSIAAKETYKL
jgi:tetratricopeptide (TPR) repeat protein